MAQAREKWHQAPKNNVHEAVFQTAAYIRHQQRELREDWIFYMELYAAGNVSGLGDASFDDEYSQYYHNKGTRFNLAAMACDTAISLISQAPAVPKYHTVDGDFKLRRKAEKCSQVLQGQMNKDTQEIIKRAFLDATKVGTGFAFGFIDPVTGKPALERVHALETLVEHLDGLHQAPRSIHRSRLLPKEVVAAPYPAKKAMLIEACHGVQRSSETDFLLQGMGVQSSYQDFVEVIESWHRRPGKGKKGRHTICVANATLLDEEYDHDDLPCAVLRYRERDYGFYGAGLIESCRATQNRINELIRVTTRAQDLGSNVVLMNPQGNIAVETDQLTNDIGLVINYDPVAGKPTLEKWDGTLGDLQNQIDLEVSRFLMSEGISESQAGGQGAPTGITSAVGVRAVDDVQSRRLVPVVSRYQASAMAAARLFERLNDDCVAMDPKYAVQVINSIGRRTFLKSSRWKEVRLNPGDARLSMQQMSALPTTPQGAWAAVQEWIQAGFVSRAYAMDLLGFPDLDMYATIEMAHLEFARWQIEQILDGDVPEIDPRQDLQLAIDLGTKSKLNAMILGADATIEDAFEFYLTSCEANVEMAIAQQQAQSVAGAPGGMPSATPAGMQPPTGLPIGGMPGAM